MQDGQELSLAELRSAAEKAVAESEHTQKAIADELGVSPGAISRALNETNASLASLQCRIVSLLTEYRVESEKVYLLRRD